MSDHELRTLERIAKESGDLNDCIRYRQACIRSERYDLAGIEEGDVVLVDEREAPWVQGEWEGIVMKVFQDGDKYVRPTETDILITWRVRPSENQLKSGVYVTPRDIVTLLHPNVYRVLDRCRGKIEKI